ncbi:hypothetical protein L3H50_10265 [Corynebacterium sp. MC-04]|uniref:Uncharacterized protein n=1 Tax=Corynebacterium parakroppenstedtii TaxID=2828363 RepID=A0ABS9HI34_9CORY|nr:hypothetical protein [Corynebacterium parakroppenstedtii]UWY21749.1 hypothetical protein N2K96_08975 [Corynebacterium kroppenstedtii]MBY0792475.1 hypothetical protein [Corynebacterium parakroppenstedtii]MCF6769425.1 hypothetical protein [Corynebacterium parakroppenstedtii]MCF6770716.1 hypothetical protein [Corynebacterium parakroppenstedtii]MCF6772804.1 hypothetical protein [Corynebacterium parakroppenstedtii]
MSTTTRNYASPSFTPTMPPDNHQARIKRHTESSRGQSVPDVVSIGRNSRTEQRIVLCPSWWGLLRRKRWADNYVDDDAQRYQHADTDPSFARSALTENAPPFFRCPTRSAALNLLFGLFRSFSTSQGNTRD